MNLDSVSELQLCSTTLKVNYAPQWTPEELQELV